MMPSWCRRVNWGNCGIPWVNCAVLWVKDDWKGHFWGLRYCLSKLRSLFSFSVRYDVTAKSLNLIESVWRPFLTAQQPLFPFLCGCTNSGICFIYPSFNLCTHEGKKVNSPSKYTFDGARNIMTPETSFSSFQVTIAMDLCCDRWRAVLITEWSRVAGPEGSTVVLLTLQNFWDVASCLSGRGGGR
jgi:hypothetical protein